MSSLTATLADISLHSRYDDFSKMDFALFVKLFLYFTFADIAMRGDVFPEEHGIHSIKSPVNVVSPEEMEAMKKFDKSH